MRPLFNTPKVLAYALIFNKCFNTPKVLAYALIFNKCFHKVFKAYLAMVEQN
jgi:hypothetical protein